MARLHLHPDVAAVRALHADQRARGAGGVRVCDWIDEQCATVEAALARGDAAGTVQLRAVDPEWAALTVEQVLGAQPDSAAVRAAIARDHGYVTADAVPVDRIDYDVEAALDTVERGDVAAFRRSLTENPALASARSTFGHRATLLHYLTANGVEVARQAVSRDAPRFAMMLVEAGADVRATASVYGGAWTARALLETSAHPIAAGVDREFLHVLDVAEPGA